MVLSRALSLAAVTLLAGCCAVGQVEAQENLDAGKSPSQIFSGTCTACHKSARGLLRTVAPGSLQGFLRQHYTTSPQMAGVLASYLMSNGATDTRYGDKQKGARDGKEGRDAKSEARPVASPDTGAAQGETDRAGRNRRLAHPAEAPEAAKPAAEGQVPQAVSEQGPEGRKGKRLSKRGKPGLVEEAPKAAEPGKEEATGGEPQKSDTAKAEPAKPESAKPEAIKPEPAKIEPAKPEESAKTLESSRTLEGAKALESPKPAESVKPVESANPAQSANADPAKEKVNEALPPSLRRDPVPPVTSAPAAAAAPAPAAAAPPASPAGGGSMQAATPAAPTEPPSVTASAPPSPPAEPASEPEPPISH